MTDLMQELEDAGQEETQTVDLSAITALAEKQVSLEGEVDRLESLLKEKKAELNKIALDELPAAMQAAGMANFALLTGQKVSVKEEMTISVPKKRKDEILDKVREMGYGDLITWSPFPSQKDKTSKSSPSCSRQLLLGLMLCGRKTSIAPRSRKS